LQTTFLAKSGVNVPEEMGIAKQYTDPVHARVWQLLGQQVPGHYDQLAARKQAMELVKKAPWVKYEFLLEYAEWLVLTVRPPISPLSLQNHLNKEMLVPLQQNAEYIE
jgi:hypothetical protein